jgi:Zn-dependent protease
VFESLFAKFIALFVIVIAIALHEFGHAAMTTKLGDPTARLQGRLTVNPIAHFDPIGFIFVCFTVFVGFGLGWGRPVLTNPLYYDNRRQGIVLTALAGPLMNLSLAMFGLGIAYIMYMARLELTSLGHIFLISWITINLGLMIFNLLPIPPLDGGHLLQQLSPRFMEPFVRFMQTFGFLILLGMIFFGLIGPIFAVVFSGIVGLLTLGFGEGFVAYLFQGGF